MPRKLPLGPGFQTDLPDYEAVSFDIEAFDQLLLVHGVEFTHYRAMRCPVGMVEMYDQRRPHDDHQNCSNGFVYKKAGAVTAAIMGNGKDKTFIEAGLVDGSSMQAIFPRTYDGNDTPCHIAPFDRLYLAEPGISVVNWQLFEAHQTGVDRLQYPVIAVEHIIDADGYEYGPEDYQIDTNGQIVWTGKRPGFNPSTGKGTVCSIRYRYRPYWYVDRLLHEIRVAQAEDPFTGERRVYRMPYAAMLQRERFFENTDKDGKSAEPKSLRQVSGPPSGSFGPR